MNSLTSRYRTYVLNDFSAVSKAVFYILQRNLAINNSFKLVDKLPVQINPSKISGRVGESRNKFVSNMQHEGEASLKSHKESDEDNKYEITLTYDIYDEYNVRTMNGISNGMSLFDKETTTLEKLKMIAGDFKNYVLFFWGDIQIFGHIEEVQFEYTAFSRWGNPLKAEATVSIKKIHLGFTRNAIRLREEIQPLDPLGIGGDIRVSIEGFQKAENALITVAATIDALR